MLQRNSIFKLFCAYGVRNCVFFKNRLDRAVFKSILGTNVAENQFENGLKNFRFQRIIGLNIPIFLLTVKAEEDLTLTKFDTREESACRLDAEDPLSHFRRRFYVQRRTIYVDGNSLGLLSRDAERSVLRSLEEWLTLGVRGWLEARRPWFYFAEELGAKCSRLVGARADEVMLTGTTTINIHQLVHTFYQPEKRRTKILADKLTFPTDIYALRSILKLRGHDPNSDLVFAPTTNNRYLNEDGIIDMMDDEIALVFLPSVLYRSGQLLNIERLTMEAHKRGLPIGFDCSHSVGVVPHHFDKWKVDFALWCSYKYLNGGPGSSAFLYLNKRHFKREPALAGWFGYVKDKQFDLAVEFEHSKTAGGWQISSPSILSSAPVEGSLDLILKAGITAIRKKSLKITSYLMYLVDQELCGAPYNFSIGTPREAERRGGHVAVEHKDAMRISEALRARGVIVDFRPPNVIRIAPTPLYNSYREIWSIVQHLKAIIDRREHEKVSETRKAIS
jgi:kynureninase